MTHHLHILLSSAVRQRLLLIAACLMLGTASIWAWTPIAVYDANTTTLYIDRYDPDVEPLAVGDTWTTSQGTTITVTKMWSGDEVLNTGSYPPWYNTYVSGGNLSAVCTKVVIGTIYYRPKSLSNWFNLFHSLTSIEGLSNLDTSEVTDMSYMFKDCSSLTTINLYGFDTKNVTNMSYMFSGCSKLETVYLSTFNTAQVTNMNAMFKQCTNLKTIYVDENLWNTSALTGSAKGQYMFSGCESLTGGNGTTYNNSITGAVYARVDKSGDPGYLTIGVAFVVWADPDLFFDFGTPPAVGSYYNSSTVINVWSGTLDYHDWATISDACWYVRFPRSFTDIVKNINMNFWFRYFTNLRRLYGFQNVEPRKAYEMFAYCYNLESITLSDKLKLIDYGMFTDCKSLTTINIPEGVINVADGENVPPPFAGCKSLTAFTVSEKNRYYYAVDGVLYSNIYPGEVENYYQKTLVAYPKAKTNTEYTIASGVRNIYAKTFQGCKNLTSVTIPSSVTWIGDDCFTIPNLTAKFYSSNPPRTWNDFFYPMEDPDRGVILYVPKGSKEAYKTEWYGWYKELREFDVETDISVMQDAIYTKPVTTGPGGNVTIDIYLKNAQAASTYSFDLVLPEGVSVVSDALSTRHTDHSKTFVDEGYNTYSFAITSGSSTPLTGNDGAIRSVKLHVDKDATPGGFTADIVNAHYTQPNGTVVPLDNTITLFTILDHLPGDVNEDGKVNVGDIMAVINLMGSLTNAEKADVNGDGKVNVGDIMAIINIMAEK